MSYPILYEANETVFGHFGIGVLKDTTRMIVDEERNGLFPAKLEHPVKSDMFKELKPDRIIKADANPNLKDQRFRIVRISKPAKGMVTVDLQHVSHETEGMQLKPEVEYSGTGQQALNTWSSSIVDEHEFTVYSDITHFESSGKWTVDRVENARRALGGVRGSILDSYGGEYRFDNYHISLLRNRGNDNGVFIAYGKNLTDLEQEEEIANTYTSIYPYAIVRDEENDTEELITLPEYYIDGDHVDNFAKRKILTVDFSEDEIDNPDDLRTRANRYVDANNIGVPNVNLKVSFVDLAKTLDYKHLKLVENIDLCDIVTIYFPDLDVHSKSKVIKVSWNVLLDRYEEIQLGQPKASLSQRIEQTVEDKIVPIRKRVEIVQVSANGKNKVYRSETEPTVGMNENDLWVQPVGEQEYKQYIYDGIQWVSTLSSELSEENKRLIREAKETADQADQKAQGIVDDVNTVVTDNGFTTLADLFASKLSTEDYGTMFFQQAEAIGLVYEEGGEQKAIIAIQDGVPYIKGEHVILDGNTIVDGEFTVTESMLAPEAVIEQLKATGIDANDVNILNLNVENISAGDIDLSRGFRITNNGQEVLSVNAQTGKVVFNAPDIATKEDLENIELTPGPPGEDGVDGEDGKTAYEIAVENGFVGTEQEWIDSLKGIKGDPGEDGKPQYVHIRYSANANGSSMTSTPTSTTKYIGIAVNQSESAPAYSEFDWSKYVGEDGSDGEDGKDGDQGIPGEPGEDGKTTYTWVKYADTVTGEGLSDNPKGKRFIGLAFNKADQSESTTPSDYQWSEMPQNIEVGGRNYFVRMNINNIADASNVLKSGSSWKGYSFPVEEGTQYTIHRTDTTNNRWRLYWVYTDEVEGSTTHTTAFSADTQESHVANTVKVPSGAQWGHLYLSNADADGSTIPNIQIEKGNIATDWTEAPEDEQARIDEKTDAIQDELSDWTTITATREEVGEVQSALNDYFETLQANESNLSEARDDIADLLGRMPIIENNLGEWVEQWNFLETYVRLGDEGLLIQELNGSTGIRITTNRIDFLDGSGEPVAYITDQVMRINRGIFVDSAQIGKHMIKTIAGGHTIWQYMGE